MGEVIVQGGLGIIVVVILEQFIGSKVQVGGFVVGNYQWGILVLVESIFVFGWFWLNIGFFFVCLVVVYEYVVL